MSVLSASLAFETWQRWQGIRNTIEQKIIAITQDHPIIPWEKFVQTFDGLDVQATGGLFL